MVYVKIFMQQIRPISNKIIPTRERRAIEIDDREHFQDIFIYLLSFSLGKYTGTKTDVLRRFIMGIFFTYFSIRKPLGIPHKIFQRYHPGPLQYKIPRDITFLAMC